MSICQHERYSGLIRLQSFHHARRGGIFGLDVTEELARHGWQATSDTLYPRLDRFEEQGLSYSSGQSVDDRFRRVYQATLADRRALHTAKLHVNELFGKLFKDEL